MVSGMVSLVLMLGKSLLWPRERRRRS